MRLKDKTAIVTGGASGFGAGIVTKFVQEGALVIIADQDRDGAGRLASSFAGKAIAVQTDVSDGDSVKSMVKSVLDQTGRIDILVNNAGVGQAPQKLEEVGEDEFDRLFSVNGKSVYLTAREIVPVMKKQGNGAILNVASTGGVSPRPGLTWYNVSKGWMISATRAMAVELARSGIRVNAINPVAGDTPMLKIFMGGDSPEMRETFLSTIPIGRFSTPEDMGHAACYLCSDEASMVTGVAMEVDGGRCI